MNTKENKRKVFVKQNEHGYWVGCILQSNGILSEVTNAQNSPEIAFEIAERVIDGAEKMQFFSWIKQP